MIPRLIFLFFCLFKLTFGLSQTESKLKLAVSGRFTVGTLLPKLTNESGASWKTSPGLNLSLEPYFKIRWKNSFDLSVGGGINYYNYNFAQDTFNYNVGYYNLKTETRFSKYFKMNSGPLDYISIGCGIGLFYVDNDSLIRNRSGYSVKTVSYPIDPFYFSPHIGTYTRDGRFGYSLSLQYTHFRTKEPYIQMFLNGSNTKAVASHKGDYIGLNLIVDYDLKRKEKPIEEKFPFSKPADADERELITEQTLEVKSRNIKIYVWDHGMVDHDTITLLLNDHPILSDYGLDYTKKKIKVRLPKSENYLTLYAHNEGSVKPNTAAIIIQTGWFKKRQYTLNSTMHSSEALKIVYK